MQRRKFIQTTSTITALSSLVNYVYDFGTLFTKDRLAIFITANDKSVKNILERQELDRNHPFYGGYPDQFEIYHPNSPANYATRLMAAYISPTSSYYQSKAIEKALNLGIDFMLKVQHKSGNIDLLTTNFESPPDTAFGVDPLSQSLMVLQNWAPNNLLEFQQKATLFLKKAGEAMSIGGVHTPNHRWVICRALARLHTLFPNKKYTDRIHEWLREGIDIDPDGQYTEKSSAGYSPLVDNCLITIARLLEKKELYDPVRKNLEMMLYFVHANGEVVTEASKRQDQYTISNMSRYYAVYRYMAFMDKNGVYAAMSNLIETEVGLENLSGYLIDFLEQASFNSALPSSQSLPTNYVKHFPHSSMVRIRRGLVDATVLGNNTTFFTFFKGKAALQGVRLAGSFFGKGQFASPSLKIENGEYILEQCLVGPYYQPHAEEDIDKDGNWEKMPRRTRIKSEVQYLNSLIKIIEHKGQFAIHFDIKGTDNVPVGIELAFRAGGQLKGVIPVSTNKNSYLLKEDFGQYQMGNDIIEFGPGHKTHAWTQMRGASPKLNGDSVYLTGYTPFKFTLEIK